MAAANKNIASVSNTEKQIQDKIGVFVPSLPDEGGSIATDQTIDITINGKRHTILRGRREEVTLDEYRVLYESAQNGRFELQLA